MSEQKLMDGDYIAEDGCLWVRVRDVSIRIFSHPDNDTVSVHAYPVGQEADDYAILGSLFVKPNERCYTNEIRSLLIERVGDDEQVMSEALDNLVHNLASQPASTINNGGLDEQILYVIAQCGDKALETVRSALE